MNIKSLTMFLFLIVTSTQLFAARVSISDLQQQIDGLQVQIDNIQLIPGPEGLTGLTGPAGTTGPQGPKGNPGPLGDLNCSAGQVAQWDGFQWVCADATTTIATAQSCFDSEGTSGLLINIELNNVPISQDWISKCGGVGSLSDGITTFSNLYLESQLYESDSKVGRVTTSEIF